MGSGRARSAILAVSLAWPAFAQSAEAPIAPDAVQAPAPSSPPEAPARFSGWHAAGIWGGASLGASFGALPYALAATLSRTKTLSGSPDNCRGAVCAVAAFTGMGVGLLAGGVLGYFLGGVAREGSLAAKIFIIVTDVLGLPITATSMFSVVVATGNLPTGGG